MRACVCVCVSLKNTSKFTHIQQMQFQLSWLELIVVEYGVYSFEHDIAKRAAEGDALNVW